MKKVRQALQYDQNIWEKIERTTVVIYNNLKFCLIPYGLHDSDKMQLFFDL